MNPALPALFEHPYRFEFPQAMRLLLQQRWQQGTLPGSGWRFSLQSDGIRIGVQTSFTYPASDIYSIARRESGIVDVRVTFLGLTGFAGALPSVYTEYVLAQQAKKDLALEDFLNIFNHRIAYLYYYAWQRYRFAAEFERTGEDPLQRMLIAVAGDPPDEAGEDALSRAVHTRYAGLLALQVRSTTALQQILKDYFQVPVEIREFVGGWYQLDPESVSQIGEDFNDSARLGFGFVAGQQLWDIESTVQVVIGPLHREDFGRFLPQGEYAPSLRSLCRLFSRDSLTIDVELVLDRAAVPACELNLAGEEQVQLGWTTWLKRDQPLHDLADVVYRLCD